MLTYRFPSLAHHTVGNMCVVLHTLALDMTFGFEAPWPCYREKANACATRSPTRRARVSWRSTPCTPPERVPRAFHSGSGAPKLRGLWGCPPAPPRGDCVAAAVAGRCSAAVIHPSKLCQPAPRTSRSSTITVTPHNPAPRVSGRRTLHSTSSR